MVYAETPNGLVPNYADVDRDARNVNAADRIASTLSRGNELPFGVTSLGRGVATDAYLVPLCLRIVCVVVNYPVNVCPCVNAQGCILFFTLDCNVYSRCPLCDKYTHQGPF